MGKKYKYNSKEAEAEAKRYKKEALKKCQKAAIAWFEVFMMLAGIEKKKW